MNIRKKHQMRWQRASRAIIAIGFWMATAAPHLLASPFGAAVKTGVNETTSMASAVGAALGGIVTVIGGGYAAWEAVHNRPFTTPLVCAIAGAVIAAVCVI